MVERLKANEYAGRQANTYFWRTYDQKELDCVEERAGRLFGYEFKWQGQVRPAARQAFMAAYPDSEPPFMLNYIAYLRSTGGVMTLSTVISKTDLALRGRPVIIKSYGEKQVAAPDAADHRCLRALAAYYVLPPHPAPIHDPTPAPCGLDQAEVQASVAAAEGDPQAAWNRILAAYLDGDISIARAAQLLGVARFDLTERMGRLELPLHLGSATYAEGRQELARLDA